MPRIVKFKNTQETVDTWGNYEVQPQQYVDIDSLDYISLSKNEKLFSDLGSGKLIINDGETDIQNPIDALNWLVGNCPTDSAGKPINVSIRSFSTREIMTNPRGMFFTGAGSHYKKLETHSGQFALRGGVFWVSSDGWDFGDSIQVEILDRDDVLGLGATPENPFVVSDYIQINNGVGEWCVMPETPNELVDEILSSAMPNGLYVHLNYIKADGATGIPKGMLNLCTYEI